MYPPSQIASALHITPRAVAKRAAVENWPRDKREGKGGGFVYAPPPAVCAAIHLAEEISAEPAAEVEPVVSALPAKRKDRLDAKVWILAALRRHASVKGFVRDYNAGDAVIAVPPDVRAAYPTITRNTIKSWREQKAEAGTARLAGNYGNRKGTGQIDRDDNIRTFVIAMLTANPHASNAVITDAIRKTQGVAVSYEAVCRFVARWKEENASTFLFIRNPDAWRSKLMVAYGKADDGVTRPNQEWETDSSKTDVILADGKRHAIIGIVDVYTRRLRFHVARTSSTQAIHACLRKAIRDWGVPQALRTDEGADYTSRHMVHALEALEIRHDRCAPFNPQQKPFIERAFKTLQHRELELIPGFIGHNVAERKDIEARKSFAQRQAGEGKPALHFNLTVEGLQQYLDDWCDNTYGRRVHGELGKSPFQMYADARFTPRMVGDLRALDTLLLPLAAGGGIRTVGKKGLKVEGGLYTGPIAAGRRVLVKLDEADAGLIYCFDPDTGAFLCTAQDPALTGASRRDIALEAKRLQKAELREGVEETRRARRRHNVVDIAARIQAHDNAAAARVSALPKRTEAHTTDALDEAAKAAGAQSALPTSTPAPRRKRAVNEEPEFTEEEQMKFFKTLGDSVPDKRPKFKVFGG